MYGFLELVSVSKVVDNNDIIIIIILEPGSIHCLGQNSIIFELPEVVDKFCVVIKKWKKNENNRNPKMQLSQTETVNNNHKSKTR